MPTNSNRTAVALVKETTIGTTPATPAFKAQRVTSAQFKFAIKTQIGKEIRPDRQIVDAIRVGSEPSSTLGIEVSHEADFDWIEPAMFNLLTTRWQSLQNAGSGDVITSVTTGGGDGTYNSASGTWATGDIVAASGFTNSANNGIFVGIAGSGADILVVVNASAVAETPQAGARLKKVGFQGASAAIAATATGLTGVSGLGGLKKGEWVKIGGTAAASQFATAADNGWARLSADASGGTLTFDIFPSSSWAADVGTGKTIQVYAGEYARPGLTLFSYTFEEQLQDVAVPEFHYYKGMVMSKVTLNNKAQALLEGSTEWRGLTSEIDTTRFAGATDVIAPSFGLMTGSATGSKCFINGAAPTGLNVVTATELTIDNTLRTQIAIGNDSPIGIGVGRTDVKGKLSFYYGDESVLNNLRNNIAVGLALIAESGDDTFGRQALLIDMPRIKFLDGDVTVPGVDTDRMWEPTFQATLSPTYGYNIHMAVYEGLLGT